MCACSCDACTPIASKTLQHSITPFHIVFCYTQLESTCSGIQMQQSGYLAKAPMSSMCVHIRPTQRFPGQYVMRNWLQCMHACKYDYACKNCCNGVCEQMTMHSAMTVQQYGFRASIGDSRVSSLSSRPLLKLPRCISLAHIFHQIIVFVLIALAAVTCT